MPPDPSAQPAPDAPAPELGVPAEPNATMLELPAPPLVPRHTPAARQRNGPPSHRDDIVIPDYTLIRRIGSGAYGEVWLAQSVTGAYRAVKIVWREDFELTRTFQREFLGIQQFEPISRGHPCLVHILHVGWNEKRGFYYCVMELADDADVGPNFENLQTYVPRTLGTDMKSHGRLDLVFCRDAGVYLADALHYMHTHGLTHRDIKPSNIIFCGGVCKLADIGLVAALGERTFVGTEGFVPPEGPGTPQADIYSLGKVLYEMSSGKDRMEFPEIPSNLSDSEWPFWMDLNRVICKACAPDLKERFQTAGDFAEALQRVGEKRQESFSRRFVRTAFFTIIGSALAGASLHAGKYQREWAYELPLPVKPAPAPIQPQNGKPWQNIYGQWFSFNKDRHVADEPAEVAQFQAFYYATGRAAAFDVIPPTLTQKRSPYIMVSDEDADAFSSWLTTRDRQSGRLDIDHEYAWRAANIKLPAGMVPSPGRQAVRLEIVPVHYGRVSIDSTPPGAEVLKDGLVLGRTPLKLDKTRAEKFEFEVRLPGYKNEAVRGSLKEGQAMSFNLRLRATGAVVFSKPWDNSLGMRLVPLGKAMLAATETKRKDFAEFARSSKLAPVVNRDLDKAPDLPVTNVTRAEAEQFCRWLTDRERAKGLLEPDQEYRLPTDDEWSMAVNLPREIGETADQRSGAIGGFYPWGFTAIPPPKAGNFADKTADATGKKSIAGYTDGNAGPAPVASFKPDPRTQLYDLAGNVWEWVSDTWAADANEGIVRGGSFTTYEPRELLASFRRKVLITDQLADVGFRVLLSVEGRKAREDDE
jgi:serine/threonine protein kinase